MVFCSQTKAADFYSTHRCHQILLRRMHCNSMLQALMKADSRLVNAFELRTRVSVRNFLVFGMQQKLQKSNGYVTYMFRSKKKRRNNLVPRRFPPFQHASGRARM